MARDAGAARPIAPLRSLRVKVLLVVVAVALTPQTLVALLAALEPNVPAVRGLYAVRFELARLTIATVPLAVLLAFWMGKRIVGPLEALRAQAAVGAPLQVRGQDEITDLARAFTGLLEEIAERRAAEERFVADLVHEFKNPVAALRAAAEKVSAGALDEARAKRLGAVLLDASARLDALVTQLLELARAEAGLASDARGPVDVAALARGLVASMGARFEDVAFELEASGDAWVVGVEHGLDATLRNLLENASSFASSASSEGKGTSRVVVTVAATSDRVVVRVTDSGPGIAAADLPRVFDRFFTTRGRARGTGLGLALVRAVTEAHGGTVSVDSAAGSGATFVVDLPRGAAPADSHRIHTQAQDDSPP